MFLSWAAAPDYLQILFRESWSFLSHNIQYAIAPLNQLIVWVFFKNEFNNFLFYYPGAESLEVQVPCIITSLLHISIRQISHGITYLFHDLFKLFHSFDSHLKVWTRQKPLCNIEFIQFLELILIKSFVPVPFIERKWTNKRFNFFEMNLFHFLVGYLLWR